MFRNLYLETTELADFNFCDGLGRLETVKEANIKFAIQEEIEGNGAEPIIEDTITLSLREETAQSFLRTYPRLPIKTRDFLLSKLFQFLYLPLQARYPKQGTFVDPKACGRPEIGDRLESILDRIPEGRLAELHKFNWWAYLHDVLTRDPVEVLEHLTRRLKLDEPRPNEKYRRPRRGRPADLENHLKVWETVRQFGDDWKQERNLKKIAAALDKRKVPPPRRQEVYGRQPKGWRDAFSSSTHLTIKNIQYRIGMARKHGPTAG